MTTNIPSHHHTASAIAKALGFATPRAVYAMLSGIAPTGTARVGAGGGNVAQAWCIAALPASYREQLADAARKGGYRTVDDLISAPPRRWEPRVPLALASGKATDKALKMQRALRPMLERQHDTSLGEQEFDAQGVEHYRREFGHKISATHWRRLFARTIERDHGAEDWTRIEIFLAENAGARPPVPAAPANVHQPLALVIGTFKNPTQPTPDEVQLLWLRIMEHYEAQIAEGAKASRARRGLVAFLQERAPFLAGSREGLRRQFDRKLARWIADGRKADAMSDGRREKSGNFRAPEWAKADQDRLVGHAVLSCGGRVAQAWRELGRRREFSDAILEYYFARPHRKSYVPARILNAVKFDVALLDDVHHGPRQAKLNGPHIERDWSGVSAGDWYQADDCTLPIYYYEPDDKGWFTLWRGQFLLMIDVRTTRALAYALLSDRNYNSLAIRTLITRTCDDHGLPRRGFYFERGIWQSSKILAGDKCAPLSLPEAELGLRSLGLEFRHSNLPRSKPVERVLGAAQSLMEGLPGYCGRDERHDKFERVQKLMLDVKSRKADPREHFMSADAWLDKLDEICAAYNADPQEGKMLAGQSPAAAFDTMQRPGDPPVKFDAACRYLLAHHRRPVRVTGNGVRLQFGKNVFIYRNAATGRLIGQELLAWFNPETPDLLCLTDMNRKHPFTVPRAPAVPAMDATPEQMETAMRGVNAHLAHARAYYRTLRNANAPEFRRNLVAPATTELGVRIEAQRQEVETERKETSRRTTRVRTGARAAGVPDALIGEATPEALEAMQMLRDAQASEKGETQ